jgi:26S proteasome regulatory subunit T2
VQPTVKCKLRLLKMERIKDFLLLEEEFIKNQEILKPKQAREEEDRSKVDELRGSPMSVGTLEEIIDDSHAIVSSSVGPEYYVSILSIVDHDQLEPGASVLLHNKSMAVVGVLSDSDDPLVATMKVDKAPLETYADIGGLEQQIIEIKEAVELPLSHPELYTDIGIKPPKGVILYGPPGTGKTLLAKAVANQTSATFLRVVGSELIQKYLGDGPRLVRQIFRVAEDHAPSIIFMDEIDAVGSKRYSSSSSGVKEVQRTMLELLTQLDGFDDRTDVKVIMATNKIEFPLPDISTKRHIFGIHTAKMKLAPDVDLEVFIMAKDELSGAVRSCIPRCVPPRSRAHTYSTHHPRTRARRFPGHQGGVHRGRALGAARAPHERQARRPGQGQGEDVAPEEGRYPRGALPVGCEFGGRGAGRVRGKQT